MKPRFASLMFFTALAGGVVTPAVRGAAPEQPPFDPYAQNVAAYTDTAARQLRELRAQLMAATARLSAPERQRYAASYDLLARCEALLGELRISSALDYNGRKADFEKARTELDSALKIARGK
jgi:hypothetical protein